MVIIILTLLGVIVPYCTDLVAIYTVRFLKKLAEQCRSYTIKILNKFYRTIYHVFEVDIDSRFCVEHDFHQTDVSR